MVKYLRLLPLLILFSFASVNAQNISVSVSTDTSTYNVGDYIKLHLNLKYGKEIKPIIPPVKDSIKVLEFIQALPVDSTTEDSRIVKKYTFVFSKYDSSQVTIPSLKVFYTEGSDTTKKFVATSPLTILVKTLTVNAQEDIKDIKEPMKIPINWLYVLLIVFIVIVLGVAVYFGYKYYRKKKLQRENLVPEVILPPHEIALNELHALEDKKLWQQGNVKEYHSELTGIVRKYFEHRFNIRALEMTSGEILAVLSVIEDGKKVVDTANGFFNNADLVKFAKFQPMPSVNDEMMIQGYKMVNQTIPVAAPPVQQEENKIG